MRWLMPYLAAASMGCSGEAPPSIEAKLAGQAPAAPAIQPYLQRPGPTEMTVVWWTEDSEPDSCVELAPADDSTASRSLPASDSYEPTMALWAHRATMTGLEPATTYRYAVASSTTRSDDHSFETAPGAEVQRLRFAFLGDGRSDNAEVVASHRAVMAMAAGADAIFELGDSVAWGSREHWLAYARGILTASDPGLEGPGIGSGIPVFHTVGNHEIAQQPTDAPDGSDRWYYASAAETGARFQALFDHPPNHSAEPAWADRYYAVDYGPATFIVLDANNTSDDSLDNHDHLDDGSTPDWEPGSEQHAWMLEQLARARDRSAFTFVLTHPAPYSCGVHGTPSRSQDDQRGHELRALTPTFLEYGVDALISSHDHLVETGLVGPPGFEAAMDPDDPANLHSFVVGDSGLNTRPCAAGWERWMSVSGDGTGPSYQTWQHPWTGDPTLDSMLELELDRLDGGRWQARFTVLRTDGERFAERVLVREQPQP